MMMRTTNLYREPLLGYVWNRYKQASPTKNAVVELRICYRRKKKYMSTGIRLLPKEWQHGRVTNRVDAQIINQHLDKILLEVRQVIYEMMNEGCVNLDSIPERLQRLKMSNVNFLEFCDMRIKVRQYGKRSDSQERYNRFMRNFRQWGKIRNFGDINDANIIAFDEWLKDRGLKTYSKWNNYHRFLNTFILDAIDEGYLRRNPYKWLKIEKDKTPHGLEKCLTPEEFEKVKAAVMPTESLQRIKDLFVFQTYTCLSYVDLKAFKPKNIEEVNGKKAYLGKRGKTGQTFTVPLLPPALEILEKYKNKLPVISNYKYNVYLKEVARLAGIERHKEVSTHWARHTGATLLLNAGVDMQIVAKVLGHSTSAITESTYAKMLDETVVMAVNEVCIDD